MPLELSFTRVPDPAGHAKALLLKGDWVFVRITDGIHTGLGEATHSGDDARCVAKIEELFARHVENVRPTPQGIRELEQGAFASAPDFLTQTAMSGLNQALYDLAARRAKVPVWKLFAKEPARTSVELYATINRALTSRTEANYHDIVRRAAAKGFTRIKCAPFEQVEPGKAGLDPVRAATYGLCILESLRAAFPELNLRVDFHRRFEKEAFLAILPRILKTKPAWIEEPCALGPAYADLRLAAEAAKVPLAAAESLFGAAAFEKVLAQGWASVIMPDVKHVGGFGPLVETCRAAERRNADVSPHNPSGPVATLASVHAAAVSKAVTSVEYPFATDPGRMPCFSLVENGSMRVPEGPGWGMQASELF